MRDKDLDARILNIEAPWRVADVELNLEQGEVVVHVEHDGEALRCPACGQPARRYDIRQRRWRHLDTCQYRTILAAEMPRVQCERHKVKQVAAPWSERGSLGDPPPASLRQARIRDALSLGELHASPAAVAALNGAAQAEVEGSAARLAPRLRRR